MKRFQPLKGKKVFQEVFNKGRKFYRRELQIFVLQFNYNNKLFENMRTQSIQAISIGIKIGRKFGKSVSRNKAKRRIRSICRDLSGEVRDSYYIIIRPGKDFQYLNYERSEEVIKSLFKKAGVLKLL